MARQQTRRQKSIQAIAGRENDQGEALTYEKIPFLRAPRILLDTNIWRYIVDHGAVDQIRRAANKSPHGIVVAPAVVYEALRTGDRALRASLIFAMALPCWTRLMPEAFSEAQEITAEIKRLQPDWLQPQQDLSFYKKLQRDWTRSSGGFWDRARFDTDGERQRIGADLLERARRDSREAREHGSTMPDKWRNVPLDSLLGSPPRAMPGWNNIPVDLWRIQGHDSLLQALCTDDHPYFDWLKDQVNLTMMVLQVPELTRFWFHEVDTLKMPRHWLRTAFEFQQQFHKVNDGTPGDCQLGTYLVDVDLMLSADKNFVRFADRCRREAPFFVGRSVAVPGGRSAIDALLTQLAKPTDHHRVASSSG